MGDRLALFVIPAGSQNMYRFSLTIKPGSIDGEYIFTAPGITQPGVAFGSLLSPAGLLNICQVDGTYNYIRPGHYPDIFFNLIIS